MTAAPASAPLIGWNAQREACQIRGLIESASFDQNVRPPLRSIGLTAIKMDRGAGSDDSRDAAARAAALGPSEKAGWPAAAFFSSSGPRLPVPVDGLPFSCPRIDTKKAECLDRHSLVGRREWFSTAGGRSQSRLPLIYIIMCDAIVPGGARSGFGSLSLHTGGGQL